MIESVISILSLLLGIILGYFLATKNHKKEINIISENYQNNEKKINQSKIELENSFKALASDIAKSNSEEFLKMANEKFGNLRKESESNLNHKKELIDENLKVMSKNLENIKKQSTELKTSINENKSETSKLRDTTIQLNKVLSSSQKRGQWGERMVEDILGILGLVENINYKKQSMVESGERPDFTFLLPKEKMINMDVKFPLEHYENYLESDDKKIINEEKKDFLMDVKKHIKTINNREYIDTANGTLDYVLMFIPNESIYTFINKEDQSIIDFALNHKVLLCSPMTLYAILALINQATRNFIMEQKATEVMNLMNRFKVQWEKYIEIMDKIGRSIQSVQKDYDQLIGTRKKQLEKPLKEIDEISKNIGDKQLS